MQKDKSLIKETIQKKLNETLQASVYSDLLAEYYSGLAEKETDPKKKSSYQIKVDQLKESDKFNVGFIDMLVRKLAALK